MDALRSGRWVLALPMGFLAAFMLLACLASSAHAGDRVYWANDGSASTTDRISFANVDGSGGGNLDTTGAGGGAPRGVAIDVAAGRVYWTKPGSSPGDGRISFANLDGSGGGGNLNTTGATVDHPNAAAVYPAAGRIYWANEFGDRISFANLDDTGGGDLIMSGATVDAPIAPMVDPGSGSIYWANANPINVISFAHLDGSGGGNLDTTGAVVANPHGVALDPVAGRIYWANVGIGSEKAGQGISYAKLDGTGGGNLDTSGATMGVPVGVAIDPSARKIYWANQAGNTISFANLDGGGGGDLSTLGATLNGSRSPVLLQAPSGAGAPAVTGGSSVGSVLTCSRGSWAPDLLGSWLYRAPQRLAYVWTRNGADIAGANASTYTASVAGDYRCRVTASNPAGSSSQTSAPHAVSQPSAPDAPSPPTGRSSQTRAARAPSRLAFGGKALVTMRLVARRIPSRGPIKVVVGNRNGFPASGKLSAQTTKGVWGPRRLVIKGKTFVVGAEAKKSVTLKPSTILRRLLKRDRKLSLRLTLKVRDPAGNTRTLGKNVSLSLKIA